MAQESVLSMGDGSSSKLIIAISGLRGRNFVYGKTGDQFEFVKTLEKWFPETDRVFIKGAGWWREGIPGHGGFEKSLEFLDSCVEGYKHVTLTGGSAGGYAAILLASLLAPRFAQLISRL